MQVMQIEARALTTRWINWYLGTALIPDEIDARISRDDQDILVSLAIAQYQAMAGPKD